MWIAPGGVSKINNTIIGSVKFRPVIFFDIEGLSRPVEVILHVQGNEILWYMEINTIIIYVNIIFK